jgi:hypothetical protein
MQCDQFSLSSGGTLREAGYPVTEVEVTDRYHHRPFKVERTLFLAFTNQLQKYLARRPHVSFEHKRNLARPLVYLPPGVKAWTAYMPGGLATQPVHNPETETLASGKRIDLMTRRLFRHSIDAIGLRSRAYLMTWRIGQLLEGSAKPVTWLSLASGSGQPVYDAINVLGPDKFRSVIITDGDAETLAFAHQLAKKEGVIAQTNPYFEQLDVFDQKALDKLFDTHKPTVVDAMGLFEYLEVDQAAELLSQVYAKLPAGGTFIYTNMSPEHPHLDLHKRGLGWPGVIPRTVEDMADILAKAKLPKADVEVFRASDKVYNVYQVTKK